MQVRIVIILVVNVELVYLGSWLWGVPGLLNRSNLLLISCSLFFDWNCWRAWFFFFLVLFCNLQLIYSVRFRLSSWSFNSLLIFSRSLSPFLLEDMVVVLVAVINSAGWGLLNTYSPSCLGNRHVFLLNQLDKSDSHLSQPIITSVVYLIYVLCSGVSDNYSAIYRLDFIYSLKC